jgi:peptidoglycan/xylan/chitin deacetylase (PgdA/CDA1 family)
VVELGKPSEFDASASSEAGTLMRFVKRAYHRLLLLPGLPSSFRRVQRDGATIFMLHRFGGNGSPVGSLDPARLRRALDYLRRNRYELLSLTELFQRLRGDTPRLRGAVAFTIDDGYLDQAEIAAPIFREFDCPVTTFITTGFLDGDLWLWWDKVEYVFANARQKLIEVTLGHESFQYHITPDSRRAGMSADFIERCKALRDEEKHRAIAALALEAEIDLPEAAPPAYAPMSWDHLRACEAQGMTFGPHTVTHPILSRTRPERAAWEITESWNRLKAEARNPVPIFCYPNGLSADFGDRDIEIIRKAGFLGALTAECGFADAAAFARGGDEPFRVKRFPFPDDLALVVQYVSGVERLKRAVRAWSPER